MALRLAESAGDCRTKLAVYWQYGVHIRPVLGWVSLAVWTAWRNPTEPASDQTGRS